MTILNTNVLTHEHLHAKSRLEHNYEHYSKPQDYTKCTTIREFTAPHPLLKVYRDLLWNFDRHTQAMLIACALLGLPETAKIQRTWEIQWLMDEKSFLLSEWASLSYDSSQAQYSCKVPIVSWTLRVCIQTLRSSLKHYCIRIFFEINLLILSHLPHVLKLNKQWNNTKMCSKGK